MKYSISFLVVYIFIVSVSIAVAQKQPPPMSADYFPDKWREFTYQDDLFKIRFPKEPVITSIPGKKDETTKSYKYSSFVIFEIRVTTFPFNLEQNIPVKELLEEMKKLGLEAVKQFNTRIIKESEITQDGKTGKFLHVETDSGEVLRMKFFVSGQKIYYLFAASKKGDKHGINWENDFEKVAMGFLDSFKLL